MESATPPQADDRELVLAFQDGCEDAYEAIYRRHEGRVRGVCARLLRQPDDVAEATQETFLRAYQALGRFNGRYELGAWLSRVATNVCIDQLRARSRHRALVLVPWVDRDIPDSSAAPEELVTGSDPRVTEAIARIRPLHARALELRALHGLSHHEMAERLSMSPAQVKSLLHRARRSFRRSFERAGNWMVAPIVGVRNLVRRRHAAGSDSFAVVTGPAGNTLAEGAMKSVVLAAIALTSVPHLVPETPRSPQRIVTANVPSGSDALPSDGLVTGPLRGEMTARSEGPAGPSAGSLIPDVTLVGHLGHVVEDSAPARPPRPGDPPEGNDPNEPPLPTVPTSSEAHESVEKVEQAVDEVVDALPSRDGRANL